MSKFIVLMIYNFTYIPSPLGRLVCTDVNTFEKHVCTAGQEILFLFPTV